MGIDYTKISPGIRELVRKLNEAGFVTTDSGDGSNYENGMECAIPFPNVHIDPVPNDDGSYHEATKGIIARLCTSNLLLTLESWEIHPKPGQIQLTYDPVGDAQWILSLYNISDVDLL